MRLEEIKFKLREEWGETLITAKYLIREPYFEIKRFIAGYYNSTLIFWFTLFLFFYSWKKFGRPLKIIGILVIFTYIYMFHKTGIAKEYYKTEMIEGKEIK